MDEWLLSDLARKLEMPQATLHRWIRVGWVPARETTHQGWAVGHLGRRRRAGPDDPRTNVPAWLVR